MKKPPAKMRMQLNLWIENDEGKVLFGEGRMQILQAIDEQGSLTAAAETLGMSYRGLWARIRHSERRLGFPLIESQAGRGPRSGTSLTPMGRTLMQRYARLQKQTLKAAKRAFVSAFPDED